MPEAAAVRSPGRLWAGLLVLIALLMPWTATAQPTARIGLITMSPGSEYWARFGHNAIVVDDPARGVALSYNYGYFDFDQPGFLVRFLRGQMRYRLVALPLDQDLSTYADEGRGVVLQWLALSPAQVQAVRDYLEWNAQPDNAEYRYDYFTNNCSTRVRDVLDTALDGALARHWNQPTPLSYRSEALRLGAGVPPLLLGMHAGLGPYADRSLSLWEAAFVPQRLADAVAQMRTAQGLPLVAAEERLLPDRLALERPAPPSLRLGFAITGLGLAALLLLSLRPSARPLTRRAGAALATLIWLLCGLGGLLLAALWGLTEHQSAWANQNLLLLNPLCLLLVGAVPALLRARQAGTGLRLLALIVLLLALLALALGLMPTPLQRNADFLVLLLPIHAALAAVLARRNPYRGHRHGL